MQLGEVIATYDVAAALRGESGKFEVLSPSGETYHITCKSDRNISNVEWSGHPTGPQPFRVRKVAEPVASEMKPLVAAETFARTTPFLLETQSDGLTTAEMRPGVLREGQFELLYLENDPKSMLPCACVRLSGVLNEAGAAETLITGRCSSYNELDAEIRRLHAQLDEIRSQAKKKFYKAQALAVGA